MSEMKAVQITCGEDRWWHEYLYGTLNLCRKCRLQAGEIKVEWHGWWRVEIAV